MRTLSLNWMRTLSIFSAFFLSNFLLFLFFFVFSNIESWVKYYTLQGIDEKRVTLTKSTSLFDLLDRSSWGIDSATLERVKSDGDIAEYKIFRFIDVPILGTFHIFQFSLSIDVPVFSLESSSGRLVWVGISTSMLNYYNLELAWSYPLFPPFRAQDLIGKGVSLEFGASKLFAYSWASVENYSSTIEHIDPDYPWFGIVIDNTLAEEKLKRLHMTLANPYRIVMKYREVPDRKHIEARYRWMQLSFDSDTIQEKEKNFSNLHTLMAIFVWANLSILYGFLLLLFLGYFREKWDAYILIRQFKVGFWWTIFLLWGEIGSILVLSVFITIIALPLLQNEIIQSVEHFLTLHQIFFPVIPISFWDLSLLSIANAAILSGLMLLLFLIRRARE